MQQRYMTEREVDAMYSNARREHAWLLRAEGVTLREVGGRLGISSTRANQIIVRFGEIMTKAARRMKVSTRMASRGGSGFWGSINQARRSCIGVRLKAGERQ